MAGWVAENFQWFFSGLGIAIAGVCFTAMRVMNTYYVGRRQRLSSKIQSRELKEIIVGKWVGSTKIMDKGRVILSHEVEWVFNVVQGRLVCNSPAVTKHGDSQTVDDFELTVDVTYDRFLNISYRNKDRSAINFGSEVIEVHDNGKSFSGRFVGYNGDMRNIVSGTIEGRKVGK